MKKYTYYADDCLYWLKPIKQNVFNKDDYSFSQSIINQALHSFYKINAGNADCYVFTIDKIGQKYLDGTICKKLDFSGGWDWSERLVDKNATYLFMLETKKFYEIIPL